jgi:TonB family protein
MCVLVWMACACLVFAQAARAIAYGDANPAVSQGTDTAGDRLKRARDDYNAGKYVLAEFELRAALSLDEKLTEAYLLLGLTYWQEGKNRKAIEQINYVLLQQPDYAEAHYYLALIDFKSGSNALASKEIDLTIAKGFRSIDAFYLRGQIELANNRYGEALAMFEKSASMLNTNDVRLVRWREQIDALKHVIEARSMGRDPTYSHPLATNLPRPRYTEEARKRGVQGSIRLAVFVSDDGKVLKTVILTSLGYGLDEEAERVSRQLKFKPATKEGQPTTAWQMLEVEFQLRER